jgi:A/G-specific adenine glycosylase
MPGDASGLRALPGIGAYTAGAIASIAYGQRAPLVDGNVARVLARVRGIEDDVKATAGQRRVWAEAEALMAALPDDRAPGELNQGLMELGATVCTPTSPACLTCPISGPCVAARTGRQTELPVLPRRKRPDELAAITEVALWIERRGKVLVGRRLAGGLYGGLWELPQGDDGAAAARGGRADAARRTRRAAGAIARCCRHRRLALTLVAARPRGRARPTPPRYDAIRWVAPSALADLGISAATAALVGRALGKAGPTG